LDTRKSSSKYSGGGALSHLLIFVSRLRVLFFSFPDPWKAEVVLTPYGGSTIARSYWLSFISRIAAREHPRERVIFGSLRIFPPLVDREECMGFLILSAVVILCGKRYYAIIIYPDLRLGNTIKYHLKKIIDIGLLRPPDSSMG
jgi:hypothetical protein